MFKRTLTLFPTTTLLRPSTPLKLQIRSIQNFTGSKMPHPGVSDAIKHDHRELEEYYDRIMATKDNDHDALTRWQNQFVWELARHSIGEELVVYPAMEKYLGEKGRAMADKDRAEHQEVKEMLKKFQSLSSTSPEFKQTLKTLMSSLAEHIKEEETRDLPALEAALASSSNVQDTETLAKSFKRTKMFVPTRSHPSAPDKPPFETVVGLMAAPMDKIRDVFAKFPQ